MHRMGEDRHGERSEFEKPSTSQRLDRMLAMFDARHEKIAQRADAIKAFYARLTLEQQGVFDAEAMPKRHRDFLLIAVMPDRSGEADKRGRATVPAFLWQD